MNNFMRLMVMFDLPVKTKAERRAASQFRKFLLQDGYYMLQFSVYVRVCSGLDSVTTHTRRLKLNIPSCGMVTKLIVTERQYQQCELLIGEPRPEDSPITETQLMLF